MQRTYDARRLKLRLMLNFYESQADLAAKLNVSPPYLCQLIGPNPTKFITEKSARAFEKRLHLPAGFLDK